MPERNAAAWCLDIDDLLRRPPPGLDAPDLARFTPDGAGVTFLAGEGLVRSLWRVDLESGARRRLAGPRDDGDTGGRAEELRRERTRTYALGITRYAWSGPAARPVLLVPDGGHWLVGVGSDPHLAPVAAAEGASEALLAPDGRSLAFVRGGDVCVTGLDAGARARRLTHDGEDGVTNGLAEYIAAEELRRFDGLWWSRDATQIAIARVDERMVEEIVLAHLGSSNELERHRYPRAGLPNADVSLRLAAADGSSLRDVELPMARGDYLARVIPLPAGGFLVAVLPRAQDELRWVIVGRSGSVVPAWVERGGRWINLDDDTFPLDDGRVLRTTERSGFRHLELRELDGPAAQLTAGRWVVTRVVGVDARRGEAVVIGTREGVTQRHVYAVPLAGGEMRRLSTEPGWHEATLAPNGSRWIDTWSSLHRSPAVAVRDCSDGRVLRELHAAACAAPAIGLPAPELLELIAADGETRLHAALYRARGGAGAGPPPLVVSTYGGPHSQKVMDHWSLTVDLTAQLLAQRGMSVLVLDNRGTFNRGVGFEAPLDRRLGGVEVADTAAGVRELVARGLANEARVGIVGWSYGGFMVLRCMIAEPSLFRAGVAGAPVVDWTLYDSAYTERYLGDPAVEPEAYRASGVTPNAGALAGRLLVMHGVMDENVHLRHTVRLRVALLAAGRAHEVLLLPGERHGVRGADGRRARSVRTVEHLAAALDAGRRSRSRRPAGAQVAPTRGRAARRRSPR